VDDPDREALREPLTRVTGRTDWRPIVAVLVAGLVVLAIAIPKPWAPSRHAVAVPGGPSGGPSGPSAGAATASGPAGPPAPEATPDTYAPLRTICGSPGGWRAATLHRWPNRESPIRTWSAIEPEEASAADDPAVPWVDVVAAVSALGYCSPRGDAAGPPDDTTAEIWALDSGGGEPRRLDAVLSEPESSHPLGGFWTPPPEARAEILGVEAWRPGRYAIRLQGTGFDRWLGIEIREPPGPAPSRSGASASPSPRPPSPRPPSPRSPSPPSPSVSPSAS
jgi:hypothetical protein